MTMWFLAAEGMLRELRAYKSLVKAVVWDFIKPSQHLSFTLSFNTQ